MGVKILIPSCHKTGTTSLVRALETLGYKTEEIKTATPKSYKKFLSDGVKVIHTERINDEVWYKSLCRHTETRGHTAVNARLYGGKYPSENEDRAKLAYKVYNREINRFFSNGTYDFLKVCWENGDGWGELCEFLKKPIPDIPFPHVNSSKPKDEIRINRRGNLILSNTSEKALQKMADALGIKVRRDYMVNGVQITKYFEPISTNDGDK